MNGEGEEMHGRGEIMLKMASLHDMHACRATPSMHEKA
jgi:hypothetical protein